MTTNPSLLDELPEVEALVDRLCAYLSRLVSSQTGDPGAELRRQIGLLQANFADLLRDGDFGTQLLACFTAAYDAGVKFDTLVYVHEQLLKEDPEGLYASGIVQSALLLCLSAEAKQVADMEFKSRDDVDRMMTRMRTAFEAARELVADVIDGDSYQALTLLAGSVTNHLYSTALPLPRIVRFTLGKPFPALTAAQRVYYDGSRYQELIDENKIVNPVFLPRQFRGLSE